MSTLSFPPGDCQPIIGDGSRPATHCSSCPFRYCAPLREKFLAGLRQLYRKDMLDLRGPAAEFRDPASFEELLAKLGKKKWFVYAKPPFGGAAHVLRYLGRYTHRMAISNHRLTAFDGEYGVSAGGIMPTAASSAS